MKGESKKSFLRQLIRAFILVIMIPVLCLGGYTFYSAYKYILEQRITEAINLIQQNQQNLDNWTKQCENSVRYLAANYTLQEFLQMDERQYTKVYQSARTVSTVLYGVLLSTQDYEKITVYTDKEFSGISQLLQNSVEVEDEEWYQDILKDKDACWWYQDHHFYVGKKIATAYPVKVIGVLVIEIKEEVFLNSFSMLENMPARVVLRDGENVLCEHFTGGEIKGGESVQKLAWGNTGWTLDYEIDSNYYTQPSGISLWVTMGVIGVVLALALLSMRILSSFLVRDMNCLVESVNEVQSGKLDVEFQVSDTREIYILTQSIQSMLYRIKQLIHQVYDKEIERQKLELNLLQSKISPHFLYNNLSMINWLAIDCGETKISDIATEMATFYRTALNKGKTVDRLCVELENIKAYINLILYAREEPFEVSYNVDETFLDYRIPTFILQPIVENAIEHGINKLEQETGEIKISVEGKGDELFLYVYDNGKTLYRQIGKGVLDRKEYGYGTGNVDRRIQLLFGKEYGLTIYADENGTTSMIRLRDQVIQDM